MFSFLKFLGFQKSEEKPEEPEEPLYPLEKNWNGLPPKLKRKIIGEMEFKERTLLRSTSKRDRVMVDSVKQTVKHLMFTFNPKDAEFLILAEFPSKTFYQNILLVTFRGEKNGKNLSLESQKFNKVLHFLKHILERTEIVKFTMGGTYEDTDSQDVKLIREMIENVPVIRASQFLFEWYPDLSIQMAVLEKCDTKLKEITIDNFYHVDTQKMVHFFYIPSVTNAEKIEVVPYDRKEQTVKMKIRIILFTMSTWLVESFPIGKQLSINGVPPSVVGEIEAEYPERVIRRKENFWIRLRMDDVDKHLLVRISGERDFHCSIVAASSADPELKKLTDNQVAALNSLFSLLEAMERRDLAQGDANINANF